MRAQRVVAQAGRHAGDVGILEQGGELACGLGGLGGVKAVVLGDLRGGDGPEVRLRRQERRPVDHVGDERVDDHGRRVDDERAHGGQDDQVGGIDFLLLLLALGGCLLRFLRLLDRYSVGLCAWLCDRSVGLASCSAGLLALLLALACGGWRRLLPWPAWRRGARLPLVDLLPLGRLLGVLGALGDVLLGRGR